MSILNLSVFYEYYLACQRLIVLKLLSRFEKDQNTNIQYLI